jgi:hypothetical protein
MIGNFTEVVSNSEATVCNFVTRVCNFPTIVRNFVARGACGEVGRPWRRVARVWRCREWWHEVQLDYKRGSWVLGHRGGGQNGMIPLGLIKKLILGNKLVEMSK